MFFTLLIPAWNCETTINRLLDSVIAQNEEDLEVVIVDDSDTEHPNLYENYIKDYESKLNISYFKRRDDLYTNHNPGNTRHDLVRRIPVDTQYIFFSDCDDDFLPNQLPKIKQFIIDNKYPDVIVSSFDKYNNEGQLTNETFDDKAWLHGNFYKREFIINNNINFPLNLPSHEDIYFNLLVDGTLNGLKKEKIQYPEKFYKWYERDASTSHRDRMLNGAKNEYIEDHLEEYLRSAIEPNFLLAQHFPNQISETFLPGAIAGILVGYFYFQGSLFRRHSIKYCYDGLKYWTDAVINFFGISKEEIILFVYRDGLAYDQLKQMSYRTIGPFVETESFRDFILNMKIYA